MIFQVILLSFLNLFCLCFWNKVLSLFPSEEKNELFRLIVNIILNH